jgi:3-isopropylmalate dehydrogenase
VYLRIGSFTNVRPIKTYPTLLNSSPLKQEIIDGIDFVVFRELTGVHTLVRKN